MVFTYSGISKALWGSLPMERLFNEDKRTMNTSQHTLSGFALTDHCLSKRLLSLSLQGNPMNLIPPVQSVAVAVS